MIELLDKVDKPNVIENSCLLQGKEVLASSFTPDKKNHETIAKQAFNYVFLNVARMNAKHNEAHLEIGDKRLSGFILKPELVLVCMSDKACNIALVRDHVAEVKKLFLQEQVNRMLA
ncbi:hypothetical protein [uncultured Neptuniibacter sp.]|uniref:hypothetical protein n=1 Tax=uncultured Neptuniibacter sp. TaxID=502143 RepID=UPI0026171CEB|nr:hypothetical protein [uncultured Neptuniibacter sp.]